MKRKKILYIIIALISVIAVYRITMFTIERIRGNNSIEEVAARPVKAVAVTRMDLTARVRLTGDIVGTEVVNIFSQVPGKIQAIMTREGDKVYRGRTLFKINRDIVGMDYMPAIVESPITGYVGKIMVDKGMTIAPTMPLAQVVNMNSVEAIVNIIEEDINRVRTGMRAEITVEAFPGRKFYGRVYKKSAVIDPVSRTQEVHVIIRNPGLLLKHGMFANVVLTVNSRKGVLALPVDAVMMDENSNEYVMTVRDSSAFPVQVKTGITADDYTEILSGLKKGDVVVTLGKENLKKGDRLLVYREDIKNNAGQGTEDRK